MGLRERARWFGEHRFEIQGWFWIATITPTLLWWKDSVLWVALMSIYANAGTAFGAAQARKARKNSEENAGE